MRNTLDNADLDILLEMIKDCINDFLTNRDSGIYEEIKNILEIISNIKKEYLTNYEQFIFDKILMLEPELIKYLKLKTFW